MDCHCEQEGGDLCEVALKAEVDMSVLREINNAVQDFQKDESNEDSQLTFDNILERLETKCADVDHTVNINQALAVACVANGVKMPFSEDPDLPEIEPTK